MSLSANVPHEAWNLTGLPSLDVDDVTVAYPNGNVALRDATLPPRVPARSARSSASTAAASRRCSRRSWASSPAAGQRCGSPACRCARRSRRTSSPTCRRRRRSTGTFPVCVGDVVMMGRYGHMNFLRIPRRATSELVARSLERVGMIEFRKRQIGELSGGQKKRVFLARALAQEGRIILLDEPFTGVDVKTEDGDHRAAARAARRGPHDAGLDPQSRQRARILRPGGAGQPHGARLRADRASLHPGEPRAGLRRRAAAFPARAAPTCTTTATSAASRC